MGMKEETLERPDGLKIFVRSWRPEAKSQGVVGIVPGFNSHSGYYMWAAEQFVAAGLAVYAVDLRGRGESDGERFYVQLFSEYLSDVQIVMNQVAVRDRGLPVFLLGHSAGGVVSCL